MCSSRGFLLLRLDICTQYRRMQVLRDNLGSAPCVAAACGMLRQMAGKDEVKAEVVGSRGLQLLEQVLGAQAQSPACMEQVSRGSRARIRHLLFCLRV